jgi:hypothetical protein
MQLFYDLFVDFTAPGLHGPPGKCLSGIGSVLTIFMFGINFCVFEVPFQKCTILK